jgi:hypothetical protein
VLSARCPEWLQSSFNILVDLFKCVGFCTNPQKTKVMTCVPGKIRVSLSKEVYNDHCLEASTHATRKHHRVECNICGQCMQATSLQCHLEMQHNVYRSFVLNRDLKGGHPLATFRAEEDTKTSLYCCPVPGCCGSAHTCYTLCQHFAFRHPQDLVSILAEGLPPYPRCGRCLMQMAPAALNRGHQSTAQFREVCEMQTA